MVREKEQWGQAVVKVGGGRGFVVAGERERFVITAGHCLPRLPPSMTFSYVEERTYAKLLGPIGQKRLVWAECAFVNPIADLAVLRCPDHQALTEEAEAYEALVDAVEPLAIGDLPLARPQIALSTGEVFFGPPEWEGGVWLLSLRGQWFHCDATAGRHGLAITKAGKRIAGGMSGSPFVSDDGQAVGVVVATPMALQPSLSRQLPGWLLDDFGVRRRAFRHSGD